LNLVHNLEISRSARGRTATAIREEAERKRIPITVVDQIEDEEGATVQGVRALARPPLLRQDLRSFLECLPDQPSPLLVMLDGVTDPHNLGAVLRTAEAAAVSAVIIRERRQVGLTETVVKVSAGAAYLVPIFQVVNLAQAARLAAELGFWIVCTDMSEQALPYNSYHWNGKTLLILGSEGEGVSPLLGKLSDVKLRIPMLGTIESLNISVAGGILMYEAAKSRGLTSQSEE